ncbi:hypothetical protein SI65_06334 [Aspergillus cristatus]|uniref:Uncharacterized protein n=1 Tax=Aspergillus cristatus TaxID=573508 RepID=A0A1E3BBW5_ASPCR|nr:hypothetical protein SI65_06334 [Aspergillus cristatus]
MTSIKTPNTNAEWAALTSAMRDSLPSTYNVYHTPRPGIIYRSLEHTLVLDSATEEDIDKLCTDAQFHRFASVCVRPKHVRQAVRGLEKAREVAVGCVVGHPDGKEDTESKENEARVALEQGATEIDMVVNFSLLKQQRYTEVYADVLEVRKIAADAKLKVTLETPVLTRDEVVAGCVIASLAGADFVKSCTGTREPYPSAETIGLMRATVDAVGRGTKVNASGDFKNSEEVIEVMKAGADRVASSSLGEILEELNSEELYEQGASHSMY